ncbi:copper resistance CopC family protein [Cellulosimicrobium arenosum]|uniref:Copper resistance protein CopC n=1 Tax=Cellulosimicrobium arenosum TaxID=2708133 RepID=A0A927PE12_9MICO|nr:copper resistance CopC family protein [Cellulosimicrobium arenosum]MBD8079609.1 copper resistance protein CopC [Cellulosimicrobium arenosum]
MNPSTLIPARIRALAATPRPARRPVLPAAVVVLLSLVGALALTAFLATLGALPAQAHDQIVSTDPADGAELDAPPAAITLTFSTEPLDVQPQVVMTDAAGDVVLDGTPTIDGADATLPIEDGTLTGGAYSVAWRVVSSDGHPIEGTFGFTLADQPESAPAEDPTTEDQESEGTETGAESAQESDDAASGTADDATPSQSASAGPADEDSDGSATTTIALVTGAVLILAVAVVGVIAWRRRGAGGSDGSDGSDEAHRGPDTPA